MSTLRGERFEINLDEDEIVPRMQTDHSPSSLSHFIADVLERETSIGQPPAFKSRVSGFPEHKKRTGTSKFKQQKKNTQTPADDVGHVSAPTRPQGASLLSRDPGEQDEKQQIDAENRKTLADMSPEEIELERKELFSALSPVLIQKLLRRSNIDVEPSQSSKPEGNPETVRERRPVVERKVSFALPDPAPEEERQTPTAKHHSISDSPTIPEAIQQLQPPSTLELPPQTLHDSIHFPKPPSPHLDPNSETFLQDLHTKYFPNLPHDPSKLSWMSPPTPQEDAPYTPTQQTLDPINLRFNFSGALLPPSLSTTLPTTLGLHHHGHAPSAAGYTIPELALLARSSYPPQRCIAYQTLGRILYRLGTGEFGDENNTGLPDPAGQKAKISRGLWDAIEDGHVLDLLTEEAKREVGHRSAIAMAQEAVWNWRRGGGRRRKAV